MTLVIQPTYDDMLPGDLEALQAVGDRQLAEWYRELNRWEWPEELPPREPNPLGTPLWKSHEEWEASMPNRRDDIMEWIKNRVGVKYLLMIWQTEQMLASIAPGIGKSDSEFEKWWNAPYPGDPSLTNGENRLRSEAWWARTREEWRSARKARAE